VWKKEVYRLGRWCKTTTNTAPSSIKIQAVVVVVPPRFSLSCSFPNKNLVDLSNSLGMPKHSLKLSLQTEYAGEKCGIVDAALAEPAACTPIIKS
jgi:hypothetical protein